jgi:hypothetical protein
MVDEGLTHVLASQLAEDGQGSSQLAAGRTKTVHAGRRCFYGQKTIVPVDGTFRAGLRKGSSHSLNPCCIIAEVGLDWKRCLWKALIIR